MSFESIKQKYNRIKRGPTFSKPKRNFVLYIEDQKLRDSLNLIVENKEVDIPNFLTKMKNSTYSNRWRVVEECLDKSSEILLHMSPTERVEFLLYFIQYFYQTQKFELFDEVNYLITSTVFDTYEEILDVVNHRTLNFQSALEQVGYYDISEEIEQILTDLCNQYELNFSEIRELRFR